VAASDTDGFGAKANRRNVIVTIINDTIAAHAIRATI
jgi:hypothetical protein